MRRTTPPQGPQYTICGMLGSLLIGAGAFYIRFRCLSFLQQTFLKEYAKTGFTGLMPTMHGHFNQARFTHAFLLRSVYEGQSLIHLWLIPLAVFVVALIALLIWGSTADFRLRRKWMYPGIQTKGAKLMTPEQFNRSMRKERGRNGLTLFLEN